MVDDDQTLLTFFKESVDTGCVWGLASEAGWAQCASEKYADSPVLPFWSQPEAAEKHCAEDWASYEVTAVALEEFLDEWLPGMHADGVLLGIDWGEDLDGEEYEPLDVLEEYERALQ